MDFDVKTEVANVIESAGFTLSRAAKMDNDDFLKYALFPPLTHHRLLSAFIDAGFRFKST